MTFSVLARPYAKFVDIYGTRGIVHADLVREVCTIRRQRNLPRLLTKALYNAEESAQLIAGTALNTARVALGQLKNMPELPVYLSEFYESIRLDREPPASGEDGRRMIQVMEQVLAKLPTAPVSMAATITAAPRIPATDAERRVVESGSLCGKVLVTGAAGFLGRHVVAALWRCGADVVALVRDKTRAPRALEHQATVIEGDISDAETVAAAMGGVDVVIHCAAVTRNNAPWAEHYVTNVRGTEIVLRAAREAGARRVVHVSSVIVHGHAAPDRADVVTELAPYAENVDHWSHYQRSKIEAEQIAFDLHRRLELPVTVIRPGIIYGPGAARSVARGLVRLGRVQLTIGSGSNILPYTYIDNVVDAILLAAVSPDAAGRAYNVVDEPQVPVRAWASRLAALRKEPLINVPVPALWLSGAARLLEAKRKRDGYEAPPRLSSFVVASATSTRRYDTTRARRELGWHPSVTPDDGLRRTLGLPVDASGTRTRAMAPPAGRPDIEPRDDGSAVEAEAARDLLAAGRSAATVGAPGASR
jgi:2-alkyl-3-oxoalkanoate reductase